jgi:hypothetical protein
MSDSERLQSLSVEELLREVRARETQSETTAVPPDSTPQTSLQDIDLATIVEALQSEQKVIYGVDDRQDVFQITDQAILNDVDSVVILCDQNDVTDNGNGTSTLRTQNFGTSHNLCATEPFRDQPLGGFCSGFLVSPDIIATAGHCVDPSDVTTLRFVFGFRMLNATTARTVIDNTEIYRGVNIIGRQLVGDGADWALVRIDRPVTNHSVVRIRRAGQIANNQAVHVIGHPVGLPTKVAGGAVVRDISPPAFFVANLDTYGGNSGSPVFNSDTHEVEGILVRGETDFTTIGTCTVSLRCPNTGCRGEDCTRTTEFAQFVPVEPTGGRVMVADFSSGNPPAQGRYWENWGHNPLLNGWHDAEDLQLVGDFMGLGHDQVLFINRLNANDGRVMIADFSDGNPPAEVRYWENWGENPLFNGWHDDGDLQLVGDFMGLGHDQVLFVNRQNANDGRVLIADFSSGNPPGAQIRYWENWGEHPLLNGWHDDDDLQLVGDFTGSGHDEVLFINRSS